MAIAFVSSFFASGASSGTTATLSPFAITAHNLVVIVIACKPTNLTVTSVSDGTNTYVSAGATSVDSTNYRTEVFYKKDAAAVASATITVTMSGTVSDLNIAALQYSGAALSNPFDLAVVGSGTSTTPWTSPSFTPTAASETPIIFGIAASGWTPGAGTNYLQRDSGVGSGAAMNGCDRIGAPSGAQTASVTTDISRTWQVVVTVFSPTDIAVGSTYNESITESAGAFDQLDVFVLHPPGTAFQSNAFQDSAFQILGNAVKTAFQPDAFQDNAFQIYGGLASGPFTYNEAVDATALAQEQLATTQVMLAGLSESALSQDTLATAQIMLASLSESALAQESLSTTQVMVTSLSASALAQESLATQAAFATSISENTTPAEALATQQIMLASLSEPALAQDVVLGVLQIPVDLSESSLADVLFDAALVSAGAGSVYNESLLESALAREALAANQAMGSGVEAKIGSAGGNASTSIFIFDD